MLLITSIVDSFPDISTLPILATVAAANAPVLLTGVLLTLFIIYTTSKIGAEISQSLNFPPVLGELVAGVIVGVSAFDWIVLAGIVTASGAINH